MLVAPFVSAEGEEESRPEFLSMSHQVFVTPGSELDFEAGIKEHWAMHEAAGDPWTWEVWTQVTGKGSGSYTIRTGGHAWADFDRDNGVENDREHVLTAMAPYTKWSVSRISEWDLDISRWPAGDEVPKLVELTEFRLKNGSTRDFYNAIKKVHQLIGEKELDIEYAWGWTVSGGMGPTITLAIPYDSWADFKEKKPGLWEVAEEVLGRTETGNIRGAINDAIVEQSNFVVMYRPDLSYSGAGK